MTDTSSQGGGGADSRGLQFFAITDFSPGIYDNSAIASIPPDPGPFPAPPGAADVNATFGCIAENNGGLGPLPALGGSPGPDGLSFNQMGIGITGGADVTAVANTFQSSADELLLILTDNITATSQHTSGFSYIVNHNMVTALAGSTNTYTFSANEKNFVAYPALTIVSGQPVVAYSLAVPANFATSQLLTYPNIAAPTVFGVGTIATGGAANGSSFVHQGRIGVIRSLVGYGWPFQSDPRPNEAFNYTDPSQSTTWPAPDEVFGPENPLGYGAVNSVSAGELFCIKRRGGAIIIQGDLNNPTVTTLPGVQSTGPFYGHAGTDQNGMYYCSKNKGAWLWAGGNASQKISSQLNDNFFDMPAGKGISDTIYYGYYCERYSAWMLFSNNWVFNSATGAWWRLEDPNVRSYFWYVPGYDSPWMFALKPTATDINDKVLFEYDLRQPRSAFTWQSLPLKPPSGDRFVSVREVVLRASNPYGDSSPTIVVTLIDDQGNSAVLDTWNMVSGTDTVQETRLGARVSQTTTVAVKLSASGTTYAPVVYGLSLGFRVREHTALA
jgi:hypothetical protein